MDLNKCLTTSTYHYSVIRKVSLPQKSCVNTQFTGFHRFLVSLPLSLTTIPGTHSQMNCLYSNSYLTIGFWTDHRPLPRGQECLELNIRSSPTSHGLHHSYHIHTSTFPWPTVSIQMIHQISELRIQEPDQSS